MEETIQKNLKTSIVFTLLIYIVQMQNLFCNGDFQTYKFSDRIFRYFDYHYRVMWFPPDKCWDQIGCPIGQFQIENFFDISMRQIGSNMAELNCQAPANPYKLCQHVMLQSGKYYNYEFEFFLHPQMVSASATVYINFQTNLKFPIITKKKSFQAFPIKNIFQAKTEKTTFCVDSIKWVWLDTDYTQFGLGPFLDNFKLSKVPEQNIFIKFQIVLNQNDNQIQFTPSVDVNSTLLKLALMKNTSYIILNGKNYSDFSYQIYEETITKIYIIKNQSTLIQQVSLKIPGILASTNLQIQFNISLEKSFQNSLYFALQSYHGIQWLYFKILSSFKFFGYFYLYGIITNKNNQQIQIGEYWRSKQAHVGFIILIVASILILLQLFCFFLIQALKKLCGKKKSKQAFNKQGNSKSQMYNSSRALSSSKRGGDSQYYGTYNINSSKKAQTQYNNSHGLNQSKRMASNYNTLNNASLFPTQIKNFQTNYDNQYYGTQNLSQSKRENSQYQSQQYMSQSKKVNSQYYSSKAPNGTNYDNQCSPSQAPGQSQYY